MHVLFSFAIRQIFHKKQVNNKEVFLLNETISIITEPDGRKIVLINDVRFKSRRSVVWNEVEKY